MAYPIGGSSPWLKPGVSAAVLWRATFDEFQREDGAVLGDSSGSKAAEGSILTEWQQPSLYSSGPQRPYRWRVWPQNWGLVAGCIWGDDSSWKIQYLDLSRAAEGIIGREERFGYIELPAGRKLYECVDAEMSPFSGNISIDVRVWFNLETGKQEEF